MRVFAVVDREGEREQQVSRRRFFVGSNAKDMFGEWNFRAETSSSVIAIFYFVWIEGRC